MIKLQFYRIKVIDSSYSKTKEYEALAYNAVFVSIEDAVAECLRICEVEKEKMAEKLAIKTPRPSAIKTAWDSEVKSSCVVERRIKMWDAIIDPHPKKLGSTRVARVYVEATFERRIAWRDIVQHTVATERGVEVTHSLKDPGPWGDWHTPAYDDTMDLQPVEIEVIPVEMSVMASSDRLSAWIDGCIGPNETR